MGHAFSFFGGGGGGGKDTSRAEQLECKLIV